MLSKYIDSPSPTEKFYYICSVKERIYIFVTIIIIALCYAFDAYVHHCRTYEEPAQMTEDTLTGNGKTSDRYVDYNFAFCAGGSGSSISAQRTSSTSNIPRNTGVGKRIHDTDSAPVLLKAGKLVGISAVNNFRSNILLYPSGLLSDSRRFIQLCKLTI